VKTSNLTRFVTALSPLVQTSWSKTSVQDIARPHISVSKKQFLVTQGISKLKLLLIHGEKVTLEEIEGLTREVANELLALYLHEFKKLLQANL
jgi:hypothetical protein